MNLPLFLKTVDQLTQNMTHKELEVFIHEMARTLQSDRRDIFLNQLRITGIVSMPETVYKASELANSEKITEELQHIQDILIQIDQGELCLNSEINEEYDDWYNSDADEFLFEDPEDVLGTVDTAMNLIHRCVDLELYEKGYELAELLSIIVVQDDGEYNACIREALDVHELELHGLLTCDYKQLCRDSLYLSYEGNSLEERPDALYRMIQNLKCRHMTLEDVMQNGQEELHQFDEFLSLWIEYLSSRQGRDVEVLLLEAQSMVNDNEQTLKNARKYAEQHPALYEQYLRQNLVSGNDARFFDIGWEALEIVPDTREIRSEIALLTAEYALRIQKRDEAEQCWLEAFRSRQNPINYMRLFNECRDYSRFEQETSDLIHSLDKKECAYYDTLLFLNGEFQSVLKHGMNAKEALGWSFTFMKKGIGLFLLYLYCGQELPVGLRYMCGCVINDLEFSENEYCKGLGHNPSYGGISFFWDCFCSWKERIQISDDEYLTIMKKLEALIELRVEGIMQANKRKYYDECAAYVAACGEVKESRGERSGKEKFMSIYRQKYSRRSAFKQELQAFGYKGV